MDNGKRGVTIIALTVVIITMGILLSVVGLNLGDLVGETGVKEFASELQQLEYLINDYKTRNNGNLGFTEYTVDLSKEPAGLKTQMASEILVGNLVTLYEIDYDKIDAMDTRYGNKQAGDKDVYLYSSNTGKVYYLLGYLYEEITYYTLTQNLREILGM